MCCSTITPEYQTWGHKRIYLGVEIFKYKKKGVGRRRATAFENVIIQYFPFIISKCFHTNDFPAFILTKTQHVIFPHPGVTHANQLLPGTSQSNWSQVPVSFHLASQLNATTDG